ncbi:unnamed protein product [Paramecium primaurelia]|uniref:C2HC/C3H-type domain-containing protein n=1 Tax=Paramecium primaurelia TaxID=5886 RepID=A0A8S1NV40_PARPR|nr:unnamed protein product [Paramecium primaurelia]
MDEYDEEQFEHSECIDENNEFMNLQQEQQGKVEGELEQCETCQRKFHMERIGKHRQVCQKAQQKQMEREKLIKRKQQQKGEQQQKLDAMEQQMKNKTVNNWREQHKQFQEMIHCNKKEKEVQNQGGEERTIKTPELIENSQYVFCEYCKRSFDRYVAERHIPKCKEIKAKPKPPIKNQQQEMKRTTQLSTASTTNQNENIDQTKQSFRAQSLMKTAQGQKRKLPELKKAIYTGFGFMDCQTRAIALSDTECPHCLRKFNQKAALRHIPICEKLTNKEQFKLKLKNQDKLLKPKKLEPVLPAIITQQPQMKKILKEKDIQLQSQLKFCTQCGNKMQLGHKYCGGCGHKREIEQ